MLRRLRLKLALKLRLMRKARIVSKATELRGGPEARAKARRGRQEIIRKNKAVIIQGLIRSWDLREIRRPTRELYDKLRFFHHDLTLERLRLLEKEYWN